MKIWFFSCSVLLPLVRVGLASPSLTMEDLFLHFYGSDLEQQTARCKICLKAVARKNMKHLFQQLKQRLHRKWEVLLELHKTPDSLFYSLYLSSGQLPNQKRIVAKYIPSFVISVWERREKIHSELLIKFDVKKKKDWNIFRFYPTSGNSSVLQWNLSR